MTDDRVRVSVIADGADRVAAVAGPPLPLLPVLPAVPAMEVPELLVGDLRKFFRELREVD